MSKQIRQITEDEVIQAIVNNDLVVRVNLDTMICCDLAKKPINTIRNDFEKESFIYFVVEEGDHD